MEGMPTIHFGESVHPWASDPGNAVSWVPGTAAHTWIHNLGVLNHNLDERDMGTVALHHCTTSQEEGPEEMMPMHCPELAEWGFGLTR